MKKNKMVVLGGSFNPPTIAHQKLLEAAVDAVNAEYGVFLPAAYWYVERKLRRQRCRQDTLSDQLRLDMLKSMCGTDGRLMVNDLEINRAKTERGYNYEGLVLLQQQYPESEIYFVTGSDKLYVIPKWHRIREFVENFKFLVARREEDDLEKIKTSNPFLEEHWDAFEVFSVPEEIGRISSSAFREMLHQNDPAAQGLVTDNVWDILNKAGRIPWNTISRFREEYFYLSNFYEAEVTYEGLTYGSNEAAFQAQKCRTEEEKLPFTEARPSQSKGMGRRVSLRPDWEQVKAGIMKEIVRAKFNQNPELAQKLMATGEKVIVEGNTWGDIFWGVDTRNGQGENRLGKILMEIRAELK